jgi:pentalenene oxygenase
MAASGEGKHTTLGRRPDQAIEQAPGALPVVGHAMAVLRGPLAFLTSWAPGDGLGLIRFGPWKAVVVYDPALAHQVLRDERIFDKGGPVIDRTREVVGNGLGTCRYDEHRRQRRLVQSCFHPARMPGYATLMTEQILAITGHWRDGQTIDVLDETMATATRVAITTMFSAYTTTTLDQACRDVVTVMAGIMRRAALPGPLDRLPTPGNRHFHQALSRLRQFIAGMIEVYRAGGITRDDLMSVLLDGSAPAEGPGGPAGRVLSDTEIADQAMTFVVAGTDTVASALAWALHLLARHPSIEARLHQEVDRVLAGATPTYADLPNLELCQHIIHETLRLYPSVWLLTRTATADTELAGHRIPAGTVIVYSPYQLHRRVASFTDPDRFDPDRWTGLRPTTPRSPFLSFGAGARKCIGESFAMTEAVLALSTMASRWRFEPVAGSRVRPGLGVVLTPKGLRMRLTARGTPAV